MNFLKSFRKTNLKSHEAKLFARSKRVSYIFLRVNFWIRSPTAIMETVLWCPALQLCQASDFVFGRRCFLGCYATGL